MTADYTAIAETGSWIRALLRRELVPGVLSDPGSIGMCSPDSRGELSLGIWLYDIEKNEEFYANRMIDRGERQQQYPPSYLNLYYMITAYSKNDLRFRCEQEQRILGRVIQALQDSPLAGPKGQEARIDLLSVKTEEKLRLWNFSEYPYRTSLLYRVGPIRIDSGRVRTVERVRRAEIRLEPKEHPGDAGEKRSGYGR